MPDFFVFLWYNIYFYDNLFFVTPVFIYFIILNVYLNVFFSSTVSEAHTLI